MNNKRIIFRPQAEADLNALYDYIADASGSFRLAVDFTARLRKACLSLADFSERGRPRDDILEGLRTLVVERKTIIAYFVQEDHVMILNIFHGGQDWEAKLLDNESPAKHLLN